MSNTRRTLGLLAGGAIAVVGALSLWPLDRSKPPVTNTVAWDSPQTKVLFDRACADCHSHETKWPAYSYIAPVSFLVHNHVTQGRQKFNISVPMRNPARIAEEAVDQIKSGGMPDASYLPMHPEAVLSAAEKEQLMRGLQASLK